jgi:hypothetical protein
MPTAGLRLPPHFSSVVVAEPTDGGHGPGYCFNYALAFRQICPHVAVITVPNAKDWGFQRSDYDTSGIGFHEFTENQHSLFDWVTKSAVAAYVKDIAKCIAAERFAPQSTLVYCPTLDTMRCDRSFDIIARAYGLNLTGTLHWIAAVPSTFEIVVKQRYLSLSLSRLPVGCVTQAGWRALTTIGVLSHLMPDVSPTADVLAPHFWPALNTWLAGRPWLLLAGHINRNKNLARFYEFMHSIPDNSGVGVVVGRFIDDDLDSCDRHALVQMRNQPERFWLCDQRLDSDASINALISKCTALWCGYRTITSSSQLLTKAAALQRPVVGIEHTEIGDRIAKYKTGIALPPSPKDSIAPNENVALWRTLIASNWTAGCKEYAQDHSVAALTNVLGAMFGFHAPYSLPASRTIAPLSES